MTSSRAARPAPKRAATPPICSRRAKKRSSRRWARSVLRSSSRAKKEDKAETVYEISDLAYHVLVLMVQAGITVEDITRELEKRHVIDHKVKQERMQ